MNVMLRLNSKTDAQLLDERIAEIRRKNEERQKRFLEVEADKQNAARENALVQLSAPKDNWCADRFEYNSEPRPSGSHRGGQDGDDPRPSRNTEIHSSSRNRPSGDVPFNDQGPKSSRRPEMARVKPSGRNKLMANVSESGAVSYIFPEGEGPPSDPVYNFLADAERDPEPRDRGKKPSRRREFGRGLPAPGKNRSIDSRALHDGREITHSDPRHEAWKAERERIDQDRINRQKTADGQWRREWDKGKIPVEEMDGEELHRTRGSRRDGPFPGYRNPEPRRMEDFIRDVEPLASYDNPPPRRSFREKQRSEKDSSRRISSSPENAVASIRQSPEPRKELVARRRMTHEKQDDTGSAHIMPSPAEITPVVHVKVVARPNKEPVMRQLSHEKQHGSAHRTPSVGDIAEASKPTERNVMTVGDTIQICVSNDVTSKQSPDLQKVKVNSRTAIGSGRVGPRQKVRLSYSSQSEDEIVHQNSQLSRRSPKHSQSRASTDHDTVENNAFAKPPRPPRGVHHELAKPRRPREPRPRKKTEKKVYSDQSSENKSGTDSAPDERAVKPENFVAEASMNNESDDDDSWEDVTTTSGNESMSAEDFTPTREVLTRTVIQDCFQNEAVNDDVNIATDHMKDDDTLSSEVRQEELSEKGSCEPAEKHDGSDFRETPLLDVPLNETLTNVLNNEEESGVKLNPVSCAATTAAVVEENEIEKVCSEESAPDLGKGSDSNYANMSASNLVEQASSEKDGEITASLEQKVMIEQSENGVQDSNLLTEQNSKTESS